MKGRADGWKPFSVCRNSLVFGLCKPRVTLSVTNRMVMIMMMMVMINPAESLPALQTCDM